MNATVVVSPTGETVVTSIVTRGGKTTIAAGGPSQTLKGGKPSYWFTATEAAAFKRVVRICFTAF